MTQSKYLEPWIINSCKVQHNICPKIWKNKFIDHEIHCHCICHVQKNEKIEMLHSIQGLDLLEVENATIQAVEEI